MFRRLLTARTARLQDYVYIQLKPKSIGSIFLRGEKQAIYCTHIQRNLLRIWTDINLCVFSVQLLTL